SQVPASWFSSFFSSAYRLPLLRVSTHLLFFGLSSPFGGQSLCCFDEQSAKIGNNDRQSIGFQLFCFISYNYVAMLLSGP
ncbi:hypothetical protein, partial [Salmonella enterica]|uniref:hypothetical protein n=1 Tax=Salmonella enterica TaxID=28901 RepID=UPI0032975F29